MLDKRTQEKHNNDLALAEKIFFGLPKLFNKRYEPCIFCGTYSISDKLNFISLEYNGIYEDFFDDSNNNSDIYTRRVKRYYKNKHLCLDEDPLTAKDINGFPDQLRNMIINAYVKMLRSIIASCKNSVVISIAGQAQNVIKISSIEDLLIKIDMCVE